MTPAETPTQSPPLATGLTIFTGLLAVVMRLVPHPAGFTPVGTLGMFGGAKLTGWKAYLVPLLVMIASDLGLWSVLGNDYSPLHLSRSYVYASFMVYVLLGRLLIHGASPARITIVSLLGSLQFYLLTNFADWLFQPLEPALVVRYSRDLTGLLTCMAAGLPYLNGPNPIDVSGIMLGSDFRFGLFGHVLGDLFFAHTIFFAHAWLAPRVASAEERVPTLTAQEPA
jgi:hypothetical protein